MFWIHKRKSKMQLRPGSLWSTHKITNTTFINTKQYNYPSIIHKTEKSIAHSTLSAHEYFPRPVFKSGWWMLFVSAGQFQLRPQFIRESDLGSPVGGDSRLLCRTPDQQQCLYGSHAAAHLQLRLLTLVSLPSAWGSDPNLQHHEDFWSRDIRAPEGRRDVKTSDDVKTWKQMIVRYWR